jgi:MYXO-CTERM domain-containing protein
MTRRKRSVWLSTFAVISLVATQSWAVKGKIIAQNVDKSGQGYTIMKVWGTHKEMGFAHGKLLAPHVIAGVQQVKAFMGVQFNLLRMGLATSVWKPDALEQELDGIVEGVKAFDPKADIDKMDLKIINTFGDWINAGCRSHSAWGSWVKPPVKTLSTRRLDYEGMVPKSITAARHHVLIARAPSDGSIHWVNLGAPGWVTTVTGVNEYGTLSSLHDYQSYFKIGAYMPRMVAVRFVLTAPKGKPLDQHLDTAWTELTKYSIMTGTFINYYVPEGHGGVFTCPAGQKCNKKRTPQPEFHKGEVLVTANTETDGKTTPSDDKFMDGYYKKGGTKTLADHYGLMGHVGFHLLSVAYRGKGDMTIWFEGELTSGSTTPTQKVEWKDLFASMQATDSGTEPTDSGATAKDSGATQADGGSQTPDAGTAADSGKSGGNGDDGGCAISPARGPAALGLLGLLLVVVLGLRSRRRS